MDDSARWVAAHLGNFSQAIRLPEFHDPRLLHVQTQSETTKPFREDLHHTPGVLFRLETHYSRPRNESGNSALSGGP